MHPIIQHNKRIIAIIAACLLIIGITMSFQNTPFGPIDKLDSLTDLHDTLPEKPGKEEATMSMKDFDQLMQDMDKEGLQMQQEISKIDFDKIHKEVTASLNKVNFDKINRGIDKAMQDIDIAKIEQGIQYALKEIDWNKADNNVKLSLQQAKKEMEKINMEAVKKELRDAKLEIEKSRNEMKKINLDKIMKNASEGIVNAKDELRLTRDMFKEMEKDGLINPKEGFTIEYKNKTLLINGKKQRETIKNKYQQYIKGDSFKMNIRRE